MLALFNWLRCAASSGRPIIPTTYGAYLGNDGTAYSALELVCDTVGYIYIYIYMLRLLIATVRDGMDFIYRLSIGIGLLGPLRE